MTRVPLPEAFLRLPLTHRGYHDETKGVIENSLSAFRAAMEAGYGIELDIQLSADNQAVVFHDDTLDRVAETTGLVQDRTAAELGRIRLKGSSDVIPSFAETLALVAGRVPLLVELKDQSGIMNGTDGVLERATVAALRGYQGPVALMSFNPDVVACLAEIAPEWPRGIVTCSWGPEDAATVGQARCDHLRAIPDYDRTQSSFISHELADLDFARVADLKTQGANILTWTVRSPQDEAFARRIVHNITFEGYPAPFRAA
ncbi:MAG: phosphodiesterase [Tabrizicola sp.]|nr:phosphodiesterase [Tabrizicola sp.]